MFMDFNNIEKLAQHTQQKQEAIAQARIMQHIRIAGDVMANLVRLPGTESQELMGSPNAHLEACADQALKAADVLFARYGMKVSRNE